MICAFLSAATLLTFWPLIHNGFINYDDPEYVTENPQVRAGLTWPGIVWAFTTGHAANWHPLTWLSHMQDVQLFGLKPAAHHAVNLALHLINTLLLFLLLQGITAAIWRSAFVAALFALHPMHVQSVAWVAERKDVLSAFFFFLTLWCYAKYVCTKSPVGASETAHSLPPTDRTASTSPSSLSRSHAYYALSLLLFAFGLMSKPMLVTVPFVLLLLDIWPLRRPEIKNLFVEKLPFLALSAVSSLLTIHFQRAAGAVESEQRLSIFSRLANSFVAYVRYIIKLFWPSDLVVFYPQLHVASWITLLSALLIIGISALCLINLIRSSAVLANLPERGPSRPAALPLSQPGDGGAEASSLVHEPNLLGWILPLPFRRGEGRGEGSVVRPVHGVRETLTHPTAAFSDVHMPGPGIPPYIPVGWFWFIGMLVPVIGLIQVGSQSMADRYSYLPYIGLFFALTWLVADLLSAFPNRSKSLLNPFSVLASLAILAALAICTNRQTRYWHDSIVLFRHTLDVTPDNAIARFSLGKAFVEQGHVDEGQTELKRALLLAPGFAKARGELASVLAGQGKFFDAAREYELALASDPDLFEALNNLAWLLATNPDPALRNGAEAVRLAERACALTHYQKAIFIGTLAAAYAEAGRFPEAITTAQKARDQALAWNDKQLAQKNEQLLEIYRTGRAFHEQPLQLPQN